MDEDFSLPIKMSVYNKMREEITDYKSAIASISVFMAYTKQDLSRATSIEEKEFYINEFIRNTEQQLSHIGCEQDKSGVQSDSQGQPVKG